MKNIRYIFLIALLVGCSDFLDEPPTSTLSADTFWKTAADAELGMAGMYSTLQQALSTNYFDWGEGRTDNWTAGGTGQFQVAVSLGTISATDGEANWTSLYKPISLANTAIKHLPDIKDLSELNRNHYLAQAYAMRAFCYFYAVRVWGDVPVWLEPYENVNESPKRPRTPASEVLANILQDLDMAYSLVNKTVATPVWTINVATILAIKMDVQMWMHDYQNAVATGDQLIALNRYSLVKGANRAATIVEWKKIFTDPLSSKEPIWSMHWDNTRNATNGIGGRTGSGGQTSNFVLDAPVMQTFEATPVSKRDIRRGQTYDTLTVTITNGVSNVGAIWKYYTAGSDGKIVYDLVGACQAKIVLYRYADILLMKAEALNRIDFATNKTTVLGLLNQVHTRAQLAALPATQFNTMDEMELGILKEKQLEFIAEGRRWFDLVRMGRVLEIMDPVLKTRQAARGFAQTGFGDPSLILFPIHRDVLNANDLLQQNEGYQ